MPHSIPRYFSVFWSNQKACKKFASPIKEHWQKTFMLSGFLVVKGGGVGGGLEWMH